MAYRRLSAVDRHSDGTFDRALAAAKHELALRQQARNAARRKEHARQTRRARRRAWLAATWPARIYRRINSIGAAMIATSRRGFGLVSARTAGFAAAGVVLAILVGIATFMSTLATLINGQYALSVALFCGGLGLGLLIALTCLHVVPTLLYRRFRRWRAGLAFPLNFDEQRYLGTTHDQWWLCTRLRATPERDVVRVLFAALNLPGARYELQGRHLQVAIRAGDGYPGWKNLRQVYAAVLLPLHDGYEVEVLDVLPEKPAS